jgi:hypothetical protein
MLDPFATPSVTDGVAASPLLGGVLAEERRAADAEVEVCAEVARRRSSRESRENDEASERRGGEKADVAGHSRQRRDRRGERANGERACCGGR